MAIILSYLKQLFLFSTLAFLAGVIFTLLFTNPSNQAAGQLPHDDRYIIRRIEGRQFVRPVISVMQAEESPTYAPLKQKLVATIDNLKKNHGVSHVSIFMQDFDKGRWLSISPEERYRPASLLKLALLLAVLQTESESPGFLDKSLTLRPQDTVGSQHQVFESEGIRVGRPYTVRQLLESMSMHSDNNAARLLGANIDRNAISKLFGELGLPDVNFDRTQYLLTAAEVSMMMKAIFDSPLLGIDKSEYAASLLHNGRFEKGFTNAFPPSTKIWHKFGEWNDVSGVFELHQTAIFYIADKPYLLTVMTRGNDPQQLAEALEALAEVVYGMLSA
ncbi:MAG: serine hydrolase [Saprospiraceae bacterium]|nr:serine hydrolase [Saprospiraceae bacterium]